MSVQLAQHQLCFLHALLCDLCHLHWGTICKDSFLISAFCWSGHPSLDNSLKKKKNTLLVGD